MSVWFAVVPGSSCPGHPMSADICVSRHCFCLWCFRLPVYPYGHIKFALTQVLTFVLNILFMFIHVTKAISKVNHHSRG